MIGEFVKQVMEGEMVVSTRHGGVDQRAHRRDRRLLSAQLNEIMHRRSSRNSRPPGAGCITW